MLRVYNLTEMKPHPEIKTRARPITVAYVLENNKQAQLHLDKCFQESFSRYGGRQTLIVPVLDSTISPAYLHWLRNFDPDIVFVVANNGSDIVKLISGFCSPMHIYLNELETATRGRYLNSSSVPLSSLSLLPYLQHPNVGFRDHFSDILDSAPDWKDDGFIGDNFGTLWNSFDRFPIRDEVLPYRAVSLRDASASMGFRGLIESAIHDPYDVLARTYEDQKLGTLALLSNLFSVHAAIENHQWKNSFCLVVGDSFVDRICAWNSAILFGNGGRQVYTSLRVPHSAVSDNAKIEKIARFIINCNRIGVTNSTVTKIPVRSSSLSEADLEGFIDVLNSYDGWVQYHFVLIDDADACAPTLPIVRQGSTSWLVKSNLERSVPMRHSAEFVPVPQPFHLSSSSPQSSHLCKGSWVAQIFIDRTADINTFANVRDEWLLPNVASLANLFVKGSDNRFVRDGTLCVVVNSDDDCVEVEEPNDEDVFFRILHHGEHYGQIDARFSIGTPAPYEYSRPSDKGQYLIGMLGLFGSLERACAVMTNPFWKRIFFGWETPPKKAMQGLRSALKRSWHVPVRH